MKVKIAKWGNSLGVRLPKAVTEGLSPGQIVEVSRKGSRVEIETKASDPDRVPIPRYRLVDLVAEMKRVGIVNEPPLIDWGPAVGSEIIDDAYSRGEITLEDLTGERNDTGSGRNRLGRARSGTRNRAGR